MFPLEPAIRLKVHFYSDLQYYIELDQSIDKCFIKQRFGMHSSEEIRDNIPF